MPVKLKIFDLHVEKEKAEKYLSTLCKKLGLNFPHNYKNATLSVQLEGETVVISFPKELDSVMKRGRAMILQDLFDAKDRFLSSAISIGSTSDSLKFGSAYGNHASSISSPGIIEAPEQSFSRDICFYRKEVVLAFNNDDLEGYSRNYRSYLHSSVSLVECFLHRYSFHVKNVIPSMQQFENTRILDSRKPIEERIDAWMTTFATHKREELKKSNNRAKFIELKNQRNSIVHPQNPTVPYGLSEVIKFMNYAKDGIGGFLAELRRYSQESEYIGFIQQIKTLPDIRKSNSNN